MTTKKRVSRNLVPVGTHVELTTKIGLQALAESRNTTMYTVIQELIEEAVRAYDAQIEEMKKKPLSGEDLLG